MHINRFGVIPKANQPGKWRLITDLSHPKPGSINEGIDPSLCSLRYPSIDQAVEAIMQQEGEVYLAKIDIEQAFRNIPVHPDDRILLGMIWNHELYLDANLPFGLRSAPQIFFTAVADALEWISRKHGVSYSLHYLDDYLTMGNKEECDRNLQLIIAACNLLGVPLKIQKVEGPATCITFLGIELDTEKKRTPPARSKTKAITSTARELATKASLQEERSPLLNRKTRPRL